MTAENAEYVTNTADLDELEAARRLLRNMGVPEERMTVAAGIEQVMTTLMRCHASFMDEFGAELVRRGVGERIVNDAASAAGVTMLRRQWRVD